MYRRSHECEVLILDSVLDSKLTDLIAKITSVLAELSKSEIEIAGRIFEIERTHPVVLSSAGIGLSLIAASSSEYFSSNTVLCS